MLDAHSRMECLQLQVGELQVLQSMLCDENDKFEIHDATLFDLISSTLAQSNTGGGHSRETLPMADLSPLTFQFSIMQDVSSRIFEVKCIFDTGYPIHDPLRVYAIKGSPHTLTNKQEEDMVQICNEFLKGLSGTEATFSLISYLRNSIDDLLSSVGANGDDSSNKAQISSSPLEICVSIVGIHFHHIYSDHKKRQISHQASQLNLRSGLYKFGKPGRLFVQGVKEDVDSYIAILRSLRWQKMVVKVEQYQSVHFDPRTENDCSNIYQFLKKHNHLLFDSFEEVSSDKELLEKLESVGRGDLFFELTQLRNESK